MLINNVSSGATGTGTGPVSQLADNFNNFLRLLTTQMSQQDPLSPLDATEFTAQLAQFTGVEQAINTNLKLAELIAMQQSNQTVAAVSYLGTTIEAAGNAARLSGGTAAWTYTLGTATATTTIEIVNEQGVTVRTVPGATAAGKHDFNWDGLDDSGAPQPDGAYTIQIVARDVNDAAVLVTTNFVGRVTGVSFLGDQVMLLTDGTEVALENVISVRETQASDAA